MKKIVINVVVIGMASFGFAQNSYVDFDVSKFRDLGIIGSNYEYLHNVQSNLTPNKV